MDKRKPGRAAKSMSKLHQEKKQDTGLRDARFERAGQTKLDRPYDKLRDLPRVATRIETLNPRSFEP